MEEHRAVAKILVAMGIAALWLVPAPASAHFLGADSVDDGEIRYDERTEQDDALAPAIAVWNAEREIKITPDNIWNIQDLLVEDVNHTDDPHCGWWVESHSQDNIYINLPSFRPLSSDQKDHCMAHEFGHALGLAHSFDGQLMEEEFGDFPTVKPECHDKVDYHDKWGDGRVPECTAPPDPGTIPVPRDVSVPSTTIVDINH
ncbi:MAG TPA: hypothetical protein VF230_06475 [Acidimicrobiales bacterium]